MTMNLAQPRQLPCISVLTDRIVEKFLFRLNTLDNRVTDLAIVSPILGTLLGTGLPLEQLKRILRIRRIKTYIVTQSPFTELTKKAPGHLQALEILKDLDFLEVRYNDSLHAKVYLCKCRSNEDSFALLGSANMTWTSISKNIEVGVLIKCFSEGDTIIHELDSWFNNKLRPESKIHKRMVMPKIGV